MAHVIEWSTICVNTGVVNKLNELFPMPIPEPKPMDTAVTFFKKEDDKYYFRRSDGSEFYMETNANLPLALGAKYEISAKPKFKDNMPVEKSVVINFEIKPPNQPSPQK